MYNMLLHKDNMSHFPFGILGQVWYLIVSIPDLCLLPYFEYSLLLQKEYSMLLHRDKCVQSVAT